MGLVALWFGADYVMAESRLRFQFCLNAVGGLEAGRACNKALEHGTVEAVL